jgi:hypothetical protein
VIRASSVTADRGAAGRSGCEHAVVSDLMRTRWWDQRDQPIETAVGAARAHEAVAEQTAL